MYVSSYSGWQLGDIPEEANADEDGDAARVVEDEEEDLRSCWIVLE